MEEKCRYPLDPQGWQQNPQAGWFQVAGDIDDFIFFGEENQPSER